MPDKEQNVQHFLDLIRRSRRGKFKLYIGMAAGVGKSFRMLQEAHALLRNGVDVQIGYIETHGRQETASLLEGLPVIPRRKIFYKGKEIEEMDMQAIVNLHPEVVIIDELAHSNIEGSKNEKRWQDVRDILEAGINVISAVNIQHLESLNEAVQHITGVEIRERVPDGLLQFADEVVNIDLTADELIARLREGKIYAPDKVEIALRNFFQPEKILQLRELALKEVATQVERKVETEITRPSDRRPERFLACISSNEQTARHVIRKTARLASYYNARWWVLYVQTPSEAPDKIPLATQRHLLNNFKLAIESGAEVIRTEHTSVAEAIVEKTLALQATTVCIGKPHLKMWQIILNTGVFNHLLKTLSGQNVDIVILS
ncbi:MAG: sensor protein KdpD [Saprospirales bacterium]|jgi:two-component system sensor histidine kinase KdpD|nr:sensor protein KdpD [Saprospirales bacterium]